MMNSKITYRLTLLRLILFCIMPLILPALIFLVGGILINDLSSLSLVVLFIFLLSLFMAYCYLFINHYKIASPAQLVIGNHQMTITGNNETITILLNEISAIKEYSSGRRSFWSNILFWTFEANGKTFTVSSLTISQSNFERYFYNRTTQVYRFFPLIIHP